ncbi:valine--tRNA ligase [Hyphomicrobium methylovorum]|uniref:valine--tRNA ligase n=1 Tax=Hyphomicrobium methylovorum TaxID=84 RepID=UPI0015E7C59A|nr:valine--tRNA ligase [Hyphomicrobium methylovorum]MBA2127520.1 valine--tRNA ligase [Hyphomicrobium methylovorum]
MLEKTFRPADIEPRVNSEWEKANAFAAGSSVSGGKNAAYSIVIPPPNVTGSLHMGHALNNTLQDILVRFERMRGRDVLWQPGTDHAGIATQMVVERQLAANKEPSRRDLGREEFLKRVWAWKEESGGTIVEQLRRLGASCDWSRERFTMDEGLSKAVVKVFVQLYNDGLIYKDKRLVNWDPKFQTAISDLEVIQVEKRGSVTWDKAAGEPFDAAVLAKALAKDPSGHMYHFRYPLAAKVPGYARDYIVVATTRPETMLGDSGVAVHPEDERYAALLAANAKVKLPLVDREIPIVADEHSDPEKGTGAVKITPAHDFNDFEVGKRHNLAQINVLDAHGHLTDDVPEAYRGLERFAARLKIVEDLDALGLLEKIEPTTHTVPHGDRSGVVVEPWLTDQWYVNAEELAKPAIAAIEKGKTVFVPKNWEKTYFEWMRNIQPWCISRQLWWGHQIPAWYGPKQVQKGTFELGLKNETFEIFCAESEESLRQQLNDYYQGRKIEFVKDRSQAKDLFDRQIGFSKRERGQEVVPIWRDEDVLDTWFSSALWPFSTLGWPDETPELERYYPTSVLVTGFDIIFFWVARMMMMGLHFMKDVPFKDVYIHALVRDEKGQKMSKSKGNVMDPLVLIDEFGADALRFTLAAMAAQGRDIKLAKSRVEGYRNFATKLWNASRFSEMNECVRQRGFDPKTAKQIFNKWIIGEAELTSKAVTAALESYRFNEAALAIYEFVWGEFCDWYLELIKPLLAGDDEDAKAETRAVAAWTLDQILKMLHPFMPFITEELWAHMVEHGVKRDTLLCHSQWPNLDGLVEQNAVDEVNWVVLLISEIRSVRTEMNVPAGAKIPAVIVGADALTRERVRRNEDTLKRLARLDEIDFEDAAPKGAALVVAGETTAALPLAGIIDMDAEKRRLAKEIEKASGDLKKMDAKLSNPQFMERAKEEAIEEAQERKAELEAEIKRFSAALKRLEGV